MICYLNLPLQLAILRNLLSAPARLALSYGRIRAWQITTPQPSTEIRIDNQAGFLGMLRPPTMNGDTHGLLGIRKIVQTGAARRNRRLSNSSPCCVNNLEQDKVVVRVHLCDLGKGLSGFSKVPAMKQSVVLLMAGLED